MARKSYTIEQIVSKVLEVEMLLGQGQRVGDICRSFNIGEQTYYRWRKEYGGIRTDQVRCLKEPGSENTRLKKLVADLSLDNSILEETVRGNPGLMPGQADQPARRRKAVEHAQEVFQVSECRVCWALGQPCSAQRYRGKGADDEEMLTERIVTLASQYGRYGYRRITAMLQMKGCQVNHKRVERIWRQEGLKVPARQPK